MRKYNLKVSPTPIGLEFVKRRQVGLKKGKAHWGSELFDRETTQHSSDHTSGLLIKTLIDNAKATTHR